ncbi:hypothetical protein MHN00_14005 [Alteromonas sp. Cnat2-8]|uniref:hypothetical protein n=1 Tax=Alteromonas sp. Cnat2-8 TaxID=2917728 RepID=UPI001EF45C9F|nr:hypothetical protein [Alteromonas sp. Cnat2-8]MCG7654668.1 hypothetical protein [Alteromonas sp. Cnat2-8]
MSEGKHLVEDENTTLDKIIKYFPYVAIPIAILMLATYFGNFHGDFGDQSDFGAFGDFFGGILNPMLTFLTILLLLRQLRLQRSELNATAKELRATAEIHEENMKHSRAVDIYEKTYEKYSKAIQNFNNSLNYNFVSLSKDGAALTVTQRTEAQLVGKPMVEISLRKLKEEGEKIQIALYSADGNFFLDKLKLALNHSVQLAHEVYTFAEEYQRLGVNNLLYLKQFEKFNETLQELHNDIDSLGIESDSMQINSTLNALIHQSISTIVKAQNILNLD